MHLGKGALVNRTKVYKSIKVTKGKEKVPRTQEEMRNLKEATGKHHPVKDEPLNQKDFRRAVY